MQAVATTMGSTAFTELSAVHRAMLNAAMPARSSFANNTLSAVYQNLRRVLSVDDSFPPPDLGIITRFL